MDEIARLIDEEIIMQIGYSNYEPKYATWFRFTSGKEIANLHKNARLVITHGGAGCILTALGYGKPLIVVPRLKKFHEHVDDHQLQLAQELEREEILTLVYDVNELLDLVKGKNKVRNSSWESTRCSLVSELKNYINRAK